MTTSQEAFASVPTIASVSTAVPEHELTQGNAKDFVRAMFASHYRDIGRLLVAFDHADVQTRYLAAPVQTYAEVRGWKQSGDLYRQVALAISVTAAHQAITEAGLTATDIDAIIFVSTTGICTPSLDVSIAQALGLRDDIVRIPLFGLGCAGGAAGLARALERVAVYAHEHVLLVAVELCSTTFLPNDVSKNNLIATALFGDGAAAAVIVGDADVDTARAPDAPTVRWIGSASHTWPDTQSIMGWDVCDDGLHVIFSRDIPTFVRKEWPPLVDALLRRYDISRDDVTSFVAHPGGAKVLSAYAESFAIPDHQLADSRAVLRKYGNMSSPTVLFVLREQMRRVPDRTTGYAVLCAFGPGFSCEQTLLHITY